MNLDWLINVPPEYRDAVNIGLAFAIFFAVGIPLFFRLGGVGKRLTNNEETIEKVRAEAQKNLEAKEQDFAHKITETQQAFAEKAEIDKRDFDSRLHKIAEKFGGDLAGYKAQLGTQNDLIQQKDATLAITIAERDELKESIKNLNDSIEDIRKQLTAQSVRIKELQDNLNKANRENRESKDLIATYKEEIGKLQATIAILTLEKDTMFKVFATMGIELRAMRANGDPPPVAEKEKTEPTNPA